MIFKTTQSKQCVKIQTRTLIFSGTSSPDLNEHQDLISSDISDNKFLNSGFYRNSMDGQ